MNKNTASNSSKRPRIENDDDKNDTLHAKKYVRNEPSVKSEREYCQPSTCTKDVGTESCMFGDIETDSVYIICEIYSMTDLPDCLQPDVQTEPKPGMIIPEYNEGQCLILRTYRCKGVNTTETLDFPNLCHPLQIAILKNACQQYLDQSSNETRQIFEGEDVCSLHPASQFPPDLNTANHVTCKDSCPNLIVTEGTQTIDTAEYKKPEEKGDSNYETTVCVKREQLTTIEEQEEEELEDYENVEVEWIVNEKESKEGGRKVRTSPGRTVASRKKDKHANCATDPCSECRSIGKRSRTSSTSLFEMGTLLETHSIAWLDRPKRQKDCRIICNRMNCFYSEPRGPDSLMSCTKYSQPSNHCPVPCDTSKSSALLCYPVGDQHISYVPCEYYNDDCCDRETRICRMESSNWAGLNEIRPSKCWTQKNQRNLCGIRKNHGCLMTRGLLENNTWNRHYVNYNKGYGTNGRHCFCSNLYNGNRNSCYNSVGCWTGYCARPRYYCPFDNWY